MKFTPVVLPLALLALFLGTFRRTQDASATQPAGTDPTEVEVLADLGDAQVKNGRADLAERAYRQALALDPRDGDVHVRLGEVLLARGDLVDAHAEAESALRWHPGSARALALAARSASPAAGSDQ